MGMERTMIHAAQQILMGVCLFALMAIVGVALFVVILRYVGAAREVKPNPPTRA